ncbi:hypothetical protein ASE92_06660 [Pedobacter sp. Leaf41]|jgi:CRP-like cAMP-binding protein|uniref:Crp/Fnr family transcriptional regulator n=1 Tax=Pedobacter sp. Leaf41 TaxID=1736218 RepID=UPI0007025853|nr:Crp/Fnr family transcriptional regulator [Pedobacter sp. Leaf41]KQN35823.1 hypothetical protein ASE92_06660 [Pedobacter sp. Leaf41]
MTAIQNFINHIHQSYPISTDLEEFLITSLRENKYSKNHTLLNVGHLPKEIYFLINGSARVSYFNAKTQSENILWFWLPQQIILPLEGIATNYKSETSIILNQTTTVISLSLVHVKYLRQLFPEFINVGQSILEELIKKLASHLQLVKHANARQRYQFILENQPTILDMVNLKDVASFLGMSLNTLNHIRAIK